MKHRRRKRNAGNAVLIVLIAVCIVFLALGIRLLVRQVETERLMKRYPQKFIAEIGMYAEEFSVDPYLVIAIMKCESNFDPSAVSNRGAIGLMQIMPDTGEWVAHKLGLDDSYSVEGLYEPDTNIRFACWYLRFLIGRFDGDEKKVVAAYNAGHRSVEKWMENPQYAENGELTRIPYEATAAYYDRVMQAKAQYHALYEPMF